MIRHIVMWKLKEEAEGKTKAENIQVIKSALEAMKGVVPGIIDLEVGVDVYDPQGNHDLVLITSFAGINELNVYQDHIEHQKVKNIVKPLVSTRAAIDYEF